MSDDDLLDFMVYEELSDGTEQAVVTVYARALPRVGDLLSLRQHGDFVVAAVEWYGAEDIQARLVIEPAVTGRRR